MKIYKGSPEDVSGRQDREVRVYKFLDKLKIEFERVDHEPAETMEACELIDKALGISMCKNLFLCNRQKTAFYLLLLPGNKPFKTKILSHTLGISRLSFADESFMEEFLDIKPGSVSVMGLMNDKNNNIQLIIDKEIIDSDYIGCHPCVNTSSLKIKTEDILQKFLIAVGHTPIITELINDEA